MNHGKCINCWWYKQLHGKGYNIVGGKLIENYGNGICYMHTIDPCTDMEELNYIDGDSWCPDYCNRERANKKDKMTLEELLERWKKCH